MFIKIYRIEHPSDKLGPFQGRELVGNNTHWGGAYSINKNIDKWNDMPNTWKDFGLEREKNDDLVIGCTTLRQLSKWFTPSDRVRMRKAGFKLIVLYIEVEKVRHGTDQVLIDRSKFNHTGLKITKRKSA